MICAACRKVLHAREVVTLRAGSLEAGFCRSCADNIHGVGAQTAALLARATETAIQARPTLQHGLGVVKAAFDFARTLSEER